MNDSGNSPKAHARGRWGQLIFAALFLGLFFVLQWGYMQGRGTIVERIVGLYFTLRHDKSLFDAIHGYVGPTLIVILPCLFFAWWVRQAVDSGDATSPVG